MSTLLAGGRLMEPPPPPAKCSNGIPPNMVKGNNSTQRNERKSGIVTSFKLEIDERKKETSSNDSYCYATKGGSKMTEYIELDYP